MHRSGRLARVAILAVAGVAVAFSSAPAGAVAPASAPAVTGRPCAPNTGLTVEVDFLKAGATETDPAQNRIVLGCARGEQTNGFTALADAGFTTSSESGPGTICRIDGLPAQGYPYCWLTAGVWSYWRSNGSTPWAFSTVGAAAVPPIPVNSAEGWAFAMLKEGQGSAQPRIAVADLNSYVTVAVGTPTISGAPVPGAVLTAHPGATSPASAKVTYRWSRNGAPINGAAGSHVTYVPKTSDVGAHLAVTTSAAAANWITGTSTSAAQTIVLDTAVVTPAYPATFSKKSTSTVTVVLAAGASDVAPTGKLVLHVGTHTFTKTISESGATFTVPRLPVGSYAVSVTYDGSTQYAALTTPTIGITSA